MHPYQIPRLGAHSRSSGFPAPSHDFVGGRTVDAILDHERYRAWVASARGLWAALAPLARARDTRPLRVLDLYTGTGELPQALMLEARREGVGLRVDGCDPCAEVLGVATDRARDAGFALDYFQLDPEREALPGGYDAVISSFHLHELDARRASDLLVSMAHSAERLVLVQDLTRGAVGSGLAWLAHALGGPLRAADPTRLVESAWTVSEVRAMALEAGMQTASVGPSGPLRWQLCWAR